MRNIIISVFLILLLNASSISIKNQKLEIILIFTKKRERVKKSL